MNQSIMPQFFADIFHCISLDKIIISSKAKVSSIYKANDILFIIMTSFDSQQQHCGNSQSLNIKRSIVRYVLQHVGAKQMEISSEKNKPAKSLKYFI